MADITTTTLLQWCGVAVAGNRTSIIQDLLPEPEKLMNLVDETEDGIKEACVSYSKRPGNQRFNVAHATIKKLIGLMYWVQDRARLEEDATFGHQFTRADFLDEVKEATLRAKCRKEQKKIGSNLVATDFTTKLKSRQQWERWSLELKTTLSAIIGAKGIPLTYVTRDEAAPDLDDHDSWEEKAIAGAPLEGLEYQQDRSTVHHIIIRNIAEDSDAYTYVKPRLRYEDGRRDVLALRERYQNAATEQERVTEARKVLDTLRYRNERAMSFEVFSSKLTRALDDLADCDREEHNGNIVDALWGRIQNAELRSYVEALKVDYGRNQRDYKLILQDIAAQVPTLTQGATLRRGVSELQSSASNYTIQGSCPGNGVHTPDGKVYVGSYPKTKWFDESVKPYHDEIRAAREKHNLGGSGGSPGKRGSSPKKRGQQRKLKKLRAQLTEATTKNRTLAALVTGKGGDAEKGNTDNIDERDDQAGLAFGGKASMKKKKKSDE